jgi:DNA polymerase-3 subunit beta
MKLTVTRDELLERLSNIQNVVEKRNTMPVLSHFLLDARKDGSRITATDIETAIREPLGAEVADEGVLCIPARKLFEIVKELEGNVTIESEDAQWINVSAGKSGFRLACLAPEEFPSWPQMEEAVEVKLKPDLLESLIARTIYSAGESDTRYTLNGLLFHLEGQSLIVVGTDGHRMALMESSLESAAPEELKVIVPRKTASEIRKFLSGDGDVSVNIGKNHILFRVADVEFLARLIEGTYPNYHQVIPEKNEKIVSLEREAFVKALKRVSIMSRERSNAVKLDLEPSIVKLTSTNPDLGEAHDELPVQYEGEALSAGFNARYLLDVLQAMGTEKVSFELHDQLSPTVLKEEGNKNYRCVVMPMRI